MTYREMITNRCTKYAKNPKVIFMGYNTVKGSRMYGTLNGVPESQCIEMPVAENLMVGMAIGMALNGYLPVVCFERHDFLLLGLDALINHMDKLPELSGGQYKLPILVRAIVGGTKPIEPGVQHKQDYKEELWYMLKNTPMYIGLYGKGYNISYKSIGRTKSGAVVVCEYKDMYDGEI